MITKACAPDQPELAGTEGPQSTMDDLDFDSIDYFRSDALLFDPYPYYDYLRGKCPVHQESHHGVFMVTGYEEAVEIFTDHKTFSACNAVSGPFPGMPVPLEGDDVSELIEEHRDALPMSQEIMTLDPPRHTAIRSLAMRHFTPKRLKETEAFMEALAGRLIDGFAGVGECEFLTEFAGPYAVLNIAELLGVPTADHEKFLEALLGQHRDRGLGSVKSQTPDDAFGFLHGTFSAYIEDRRAEPRDDLLTTLATTPYPDGSMPEVIDVVRLSSALFAAGSGTTAHLLGSSFRLIAENAALQQSLRKEPGLIPNFIEETLRVEPPVKGTFRLARVSKQVRGVGLPPGSTVMLLSAGANRDGRKFEQPNEFRLDRENGRQHLSFGHGIHLCAGAALARAESRVAVRCLLDRLGEIRISEAEHGPEGARRFEYLPTYHLRGLASLHLKFAALS